MSVQESHGSFTVKAVVVLQYRLAVCHLIAGKTRPRIPGAWILTVETGRTMPTAFDNTRASSLPLCGVDL